MAKDKKRKNSGAAAERKKVAMEQKKLLGVINADRARVFEQGENIGYTNATVIMLWLLHMRYGFGTKRLTVFLNEITDFCREYVLPGKEKREGKFGGVTLEDMCEVLKDECKIEIDLMSGLITVPTLEVMEGVDSDAKDREAESLAG